MISKDEIKYIAKLEAAVKESLAWLDKFGEHAPITFGGEQELHDTLQEALASKPTPNYAMVYLQVSAQPSVHADAGDSAASTSLTNASAESKSRKVAKRTQRG